MGRQPLAGENIRFNVLPNTALVAAGVGTGAIHFDARLNNVGNITITSAGIILGRGNPGRGANVIGDGLSFVGGPAISNVSSKSITVYNTNIIAGGGATGRQWFGPNGKGYQWEYQAAAGGGIGQHGGRGDCPTYVEYRWNAGKKVYNNEERVSAGVPGRAGVAGSGNVVVNDPNLT